MKFKIGDRVRVVNCPWFGPHEPHKGDVGTITGLAWPWIDVVVDVDGKTISPWSFLERELELFQKPNDWENDLELV